MAGMYDRRLSAVGDLTLPFQPPDGRHVFHQYVIRSARRDALKKHLLDQGVSTLIRYPIPIHMQPAYRDPNVPAGGLPNSERAAREVLSLPIYPELGEEAIRTVCQAVIDFFKVG
jgi:dTDP-4-amino-4,6-dideoxygalactose transaminase